MGNIALLHAGLKVNEVLSVFGHVGITCRIDFVQVFFGKHDAVKFSTKLNCVAKNLLVF